MDLEIDRLARTVIDVGFHIHDDLGPGLLESVYETILFEKLIQLGMRVDRQRPIDIAYDGVHIPSAFRLDLLVEEILIIEIKATEMHQIVHAKQLLTYLKLSRLPLGILMNFGTATFKEGVRRLANTRTALAS